MERVNPLAMAGSGVQDKPQVESTDRNSRGEGWLVTVFNNETNTYDEVILILMVATQCSMDEAAMETWEIDRLGSSVVHLGDELECRTVAEIIATIGIKVEVTPDP